MLRHGFKRYFIETFTNLVQDDWIVRLLDPRNNVMQGLLRKVKLDETAAKLRATLQEQVADFKNGTRRELNAELTRLDEEFEAGRSHFATRTDLEREKEDLRRRASNECTFATRDNYRIARWYDKLGVFICGQVLPEPARVIVFSGRSYY